METTRHLSACTVGSGQRGRYSDSLLPRMVRGSNPGGGRDFPVQTGRGAHAASCTVGTGLPFRG